MPANASSFRPLRYTPMIIHLRVTFAGLVFNCSPHAGLCGSAGLWKSSGGLCFFRLVRRVVSAFFCSATRLGCRCVLSNISAFTGSVWTSVLSTTGSDKRHCFEWQRPRRDLGGYLRCWWNVHLIRSLYFLHTSEEFLLFSELLLCRTLNACLIFWVDYYISLICMYLKPDTCILTSS